MQKLSSEKTLQISQTDELISLIYKITDKQQKFTELSTQFDENISKTINLVQSAFEKAAKKKKKEIRLLLTEHEQKLNEIQQEFQVNQKNLALVFTTTKNSYLEITEQLYQEQQNFIMQFCLDEIAHNNSYIMMIYELLTDSIFFHEDQRLNNIKLNEYIQQSRTNKLIMLHNALKQLIQQLLKIEENMNISLNQQKLNSNFSQLLLRLGAFTQLLKQSSKKLDELYTDIQNQELEIKYQEKIIQSNIQLINQLLLEQQNKQKDEQVDLVSQNEKLFKVLNKLKEDFEKMKHYQKQNSEYFKTFIELLNLKNEKSDKIKSIEPLNRKSTLINIKPILLQRSRIFSDSKQDFYSNKELSNTTSTTQKNDNLFESQNLYQSQLLGKLSTSAQLPSLTDIPQLNKQNSQSANKTKLNFHQKDQKLLKAGLIVDKKTAIPLKCSCPPLCLCQAQLYSQTHQCNNQLYINQSGEIICQKCNFQQEVWMYNFNCPQKKVKNKFRTCQEFLDAIWNNIKTLTINQEIVEFWGRLQVSCYLGFQTNNQILNDEHLINFITNCPSICKCKHLQSQQQYHYCNTMLQITKSGQIYCKKCQTYGIIAQQFIFCTEREKFNLFSNLDDFLNAVVVSEYGNNNCKSKAQIFNKLDQRYLVQSWID